ncbi:holliday junction resolvase [Streptomyces phage Vorvolakos]|nr:holliday junction resolvase [Streptomyces phage Vorvolakos]
MPSQSRKHRGYRSQKVFADYVRPVFPHAEPTGAGRQGRDILSTPGVWFELKARAGFNPLEALKQMERESEGDDIQAAVLRMNGQGEANIGQWVVCLRADTLLRLLKEAGYGPEDARGA